MQPASVAIFDPMILTSKFEGSLNVARWKHTTASIGISGNVLGAGSMHSSKNINLVSCELFNINSHNWSLVANLSNPHSFMPMVPLIPVSSSILNTGRRATNVFPSTVELYNPLTNTLSSSSSISVNHYSHTGINAVQLYVAEYQRFGEYIGRDSQNMNSCATK